MPSATSIPNCHKFGGEWGWGGFHTSYKSNAYVCKGRKKTVEVEESCRIVGLDTGCRKQQHLSHTSDILWVRVCKQGTRRPMRHGGSYWEQDKRARGRSECQCKGSGHSRSTFDNYVKGKVVSLDSFQKCSLYGATGSSPKSLIFRIRESRSWGAAAQVATSPADSVGGYIGLSCISGR